MAGCGQELNWVTQMLAALTLQRRKGKSCVGRDSQEGSGRGTWEPGELRSGRQFRWEQHTPRHGVRFVIVSVAKTWISTH